MECQVVRYQVRSTPGNLAVLEPSSIAFPPPAGKDRHQATRQNDRLITLVTPGIDRVPGACGCTSPSDVKCPEVAHAGDNVRPRPAERFGGTRDGDRPTHHHELRERTSPL